MDNTPSTIAEKSCVIETMFDAQVLHVDSLHQETNDKLPMSATPNMARKMGSLPTVMLHNVQRLSSASFLSIQSTLTYLFSVWYASTLSHGSREHKLHVRRPRSQRMESLRASVPCAVFPQVGRMVIIFPESAPLGRFPATQGAVFLPSAKTAGLPVEILLDCCHCGGHELVGTAGHRGMLPCFLGGRVSRLLSSISRAWTILGRVSAGSITSSMRPRLAAT